AVTPLLLRHIGLEQVLVAEDEMGSLALDDQGIERRQNVHAFTAAIRGRFQSLRPRPMLLLAGAFECDRNQFLVLAKELAYANTATGLGIKVAPGTTAFSSTPVPPAP
ncbi:MAG TPA: hypothetical protein VFO24_00480, partial [Usitatibacter sp.]|nr:hypothetical protein [Usitatibacter sp.]